MSLQNNQLFLQLSLINIMVYTLLPQLNFSVLMILFFSFMKKKAIPSSVEVALKRIDPQIYPNVRVLLKIAATLPLTTALVSTANVRSRSRRDRLRAYSRQAEANLTPRALSSLAITYLHLVDLHIENNDNVCEQFVDKYLEVHPSKLETGFVPPKKFNNNDFISGE